MQLFPIISEFIALVHKSPTHRTTLAHFQHPQTLMSSSESQCVRARCAIRHLGATKGNRADTASIISSLHAENDVMIVVSETPACQHQKTLPIQPRSPSRFTMLYLLHLYLVIPVRREELHGSSSLSEASPAHNICARVALL